MAAEFSGLNHAASFCGTGGVLSRYAMLLVAYAQATERCLGTFGAETNGIAQIEVKDRGAIRAMKRSRESCAWGGVS